MEDLVKDDQTSVKHTKSRNALRWRHNDHAGVSNHQPHGCLLNRLFRRKSKKTSKLRVTGLCAGNSPGTGEFPAQMASYAENVSIWWRHHGACISCHGLYDAMFVKYGYKIYFRFFPEQSPVMKMQPRWRIIPWDWPIVKRYICHIIMSISCFSYSRCIGISVPPSVNMNMRLFQNVYLFIAIADYNVVFSDHTCVWLKIYLILSRHCEGIFLGVCPYML